MNKARHAFTLIEVLLALAIFAVAISMLSQSVVNTLTSRNVLRSHKNVDVDIRFVRRHVLSITDRDDVESGDTLTTLSSGTANWEAEIEETNLVDVFKLILSITLTDPDTREEDIHIQELYLLRPTWSESSDRDILLEDKKQSVLQNRHF